MDLLQFQIQARPAATSTNQPASKDDKLIHTSKYKADSQEQCCKEEATALLIAWTDIFYLFYASICVCELFVDVS